MRAQTNALEAGAHRIVRVLKEAGHDALFAGGCVRDMLLERPPKDFDIATDAVPDRIAELFPRTLEVGKAFGVMCVVMDDHPFEVATFRRDVNYQDGRHPENIEFTNAQEDAMRRDFTVNGLFYDPDRKEVIDYVGGRQDLHCKIIRAIGAPEQRFEEDYLRMMRAVRFTCTLGFTLEEVTRRAIRDRAPHIRDISIERVQQEFTRILLEAPRAGRGLEMLYDLGLLQVFLPEVAALHGVEQPPCFHPEGDAFRHTVIMLDEMESPDMNLAYAVLLHDVGKPGTAAIGPDKATGGERIRFDGHAEAGAEMAEAIMQRLRLPRRHIDAVRHCVQHHMRFMHVQSMRKAKLRHFVGHPLFKTELELHRLDCHSSHGHLDNHTFLLEYLQQLEQEEDAALPARWVNGHDIIAMGISAGPDVGHWLKTAYDAQLEQRFPDKATLLQWLRKEIQKIGTSPSI